MILPSLRSRKVVSIGAGMFILLGLVAACSEDATDPATIDVPTPLPTFSPTSPPPQDDTILRATLSLSPLNAVPPVVFPSQATGSATITLNLETQILTVTGSFQNLSSPLLPIGDEGPGHIHLALPDPGELPSAATGPILYPLSLSLNSTVSVSGTFSGSYFLPQDIVADPASLPAGFDPTIDPLVSLVNGEMYINIHTQNNPSGELRGQIEFPF